MERMIAGIDIGGTKIRWVVADSKHRILRSGEIKTPKNLRKFEDFFSALCRDLLSCGVTHLGVSIAGVISGSTLEESPNLPEFRNIHFAQLVPHRMTLRVDNDARCFARAELKRAAQSNLLALILGTGVGRGLIRNGTVAMIRRFESPEAWEKEYQRHTNDPAKPLAQFLAPKIAALAKETKATKIILGGGRFRTEGLYRELSKELHRRMPKATIHRSHLRQNAAVLGATLLF